MNIQVPNALPMAVLSLVLCAPIAADAQPASRTVRLPVTRDTWFSNFGKEGDGNLGAAPQLKLKSIQEMSVIDVDPEPLRGHVVQSATLHVRLSGNERLRRVTVSSFGADWVEGTGHSYDPEPGSSSFNRK